VFYTPWGEQVTAGDSIELITRDYSNHNMHWMRVGAPGGFDFSEWTPALQVFGDAGHDIKATITLWQKQTVTPITVTGADNTTTFTLDVPVDAEHGIHQGYIQFYDSATGYMHEVPYSYSVMVDVDAAEGVEKTIVDGVGAEYTPYENGAVLSSVGSLAGAPGDMGGWRTFLINVPDQYPTYNVTTLVFKVVWQNTATVVDMALFYRTYHTMATTMSNFATTEPTGELQNLMIYEHGGLVNGSYYLGIRCQVFNGTDMPEDITLTVQSFEALPSPTLASTWTEIGGGSGSSAGSRIGVWPTRSEQSRGWARMIGRWGLSSLTTVASARHSTNRSTSSARPRGPRSFSGSRRNRGQSTRCNRSDGPSGRSGWMTGSLREPRSSRRKSHQVPGRTRTPEIIRCARSCGSRSPRCMLLALSGWKPARSIQNLRLTAPCDGAL